MKAKFLSALFVILHTAICFAQNTYTIGSGTTSNIYYSYPAPYGNYYYGAKNQFIYLASELTAAGATADGVLCPGDIVTLPPSSTLSPKL